MGMYTTVRCEFGEVQFKFGDDDCQHVGIGEKIGRYVGAPPVDDGVYEGLGDIPAGFATGAFSMHWVIVRDGVVVAVLPDDGKGEEEQMQHGGPKWRRPSWYQAQQIADQYGVKVIP